MEKEETILRYIDGEMTPSEKEAFEINLETDAELKAEYETYLSLIDGIQINEKREQKLRIKRTLEKSNSITTTKFLTMNTNKEKKNRILPIAASVALIAIAAYFFTMNSGTDPQKLYADNYKSDVNFTSKYIDEVGTSGFASTNPDSTIALPDGTIISEVEFLRTEQIRLDSLALGLSAFKKADWNKTKGILFDYIAKYTYPVEDNQLALFYYAKTLLNNGDYVKAIEKYGQFLDGKKIDKEIMDVAEFDLALAYLHNDPIKAKKKFDDISKNMGHTYRDTAKGLYDSL